MTDTFWTYTYVDRDTVRDGLKSGDDFCPRRLWLTADAAKKAAEEDWLEINDNDPNLDKLEWDEEDCDSELNYRADIDFGTFYRVLYLKVVP